MENFTWYHGKNSLLYIIYLKVIFFYIDTEKDVEAPLSTPELGNAKHWNMKYIWHNILILHL